MAWTNSKVFGVFLEEALSGTTAHDLNSNTFKNALFKDTITPSNTVAAAASSYNGGVWLAADEVTSTGEWDAGGVALTSPSIARTNAVVTWDASDTQSAAGATMSDIYGSLIYNDTLSDRGVCYLYFGGVSAVSNGVFTVVYNASGIATFTAS